MKSSRAVSAMGQAKADALPPTTYNGISANRQKHP